MRLIINIDIILNQHQQQQHPQHINYTNNIYGTYNTHQYQIIMDIIKHKNIIINNENPMQHNHKQYDHIHIIHIQQSSIFLVFEKDNIITLLSLGITFFTIGMVENQNLAAHVVFLIGILEANVPEGLL
eukprot:211096_1